MTDIKTPPRPLTTLRAGAAALLPIYPETFEDVVRLARMAIISGMIKPLEKGFGQNKETERPEATEARATMIILEGMEIGLPPMQATQLIAMINGRMTVHSEGVPGILLSKGFKLKQQYVGTPFEDDYAAVCTLTRPDGESITSTFSVRDAKDADLWEDSPTVKKFNGDTKPNDSPWFRYRKRMLWARALGFAAKDFAADAMRGLMVREEMEDLLRSRDVVDLTPVRQIAEIPEVPPDDTPDIIDPIPEVDVDAPPETMSPESEKNAIATIAAALDDVQAKFYAEVLDGYEDVISSMSDEGKRHVEEAVVGRLLKAYAKGTTKAKFVDDVMPLLDKLSDPARRSVEAVFEGRKK